jgi:hypothetical protein
MAEIVRMKTGHPLTGTWRDSDQECGATVQFTVSAVGDGFDVKAVDTSDAETLDISQVRWDGRVLRFVSFVPSTNHRVEYELELVSPNEVVLSYTVRAERWVRADSTA